jgi:hypothetical protein
MDLPKECNKNEITIKYYPVNGQPCANVPFRFQDIIILA